MYGYMKTEYLESEGTEPLPRPPTFDLKGQIK